MSGDLQSTLEEAEQEIGKESEECGGDGAGEDEGIADQGDTAKDEGAQAAGADGGGNGGDADGDDSSGALADAADERDGNQKAEEGEAGYGLEHAGDAQRDGAQGGPLHNEHAERDADENGNDHGDEDEREVIEGGAGDFGAVIGKERPSSHLGAHALAPGVMARDEVKARTSAWSRRRNSRGVALATMRPAWSRTMREARSRASRKS